MTTLTRRRTEVLEGGPINVAGVEAVYPEILAPSDPTGGSPPQFALTSGTDLAGASWVAGQWVASSWQARTRSAVAETPTIGAAGSGAGLEIEAAQNYLLWCRPQGGAGPIVLCCVVPVQ